MSPVSPLPSIVLTGASGFVGRHVLPLLAEPGRSVLAVDCVEPAQALPAGIAFHRSDLSDPADLIPPEIDVGAGFTLIHLAWDMRRGGTFAPQLEQTRLLAGLLDYWTERGLGKLVAMGSAEEYGARAGIIHETDPPLMPLSPYGLAKHSAWLLSSAWARRMERAVFWLRPFVVYGAGQRGDMLLPYAIAQARAKRPAEFTDGLQERDVVYVTDVADAITAAAMSELKGAHVLNLGCGRPVAVRDMLMEIAQLLDAVDYFKLGARPRRMGEPDRQVADSGVARDLLGWTPTVDWREGIGRMVNG